MSGTGLLKLQKYLIGLFDGKATFINEIWKGVVFPIIYTFSGLLLLCIIAYTLLAPRQGGGRFDISLLPFTGPISIRNCIYLELAIGVVGLLCGVRAKVFRNIAIILILYVIALLIRNAYADQIDIVVMNIGLCLVFFVASYWFTIKLGLYRNAFPYMLLLVFTVYGIIALTDIVTNPIVGHRLQILFNHANHLGNVLAFALIYCFSVMLCVKTSWFRILLWILIAMLTIALVCTKSRGAWLGAVISFVICIFYFKKYIFHKVIYLSAMLLMLIVLGAIVTCSPREIGKRFSGNSPDVQFSVGNRLKLWRITTVMISDHWLTGVGIGAFGTYLEQEYKTDFENNGKFISAMNSYLTLAVEAGIPILLLYLFCLYYACSKAVGACIRQYGIAVGITVGLTCGIYSMLIFALTTNTIEAVYANVLVWCSLGYLVSLRDIESISVMSDSVDQYLCSSRESLFP